MIFLLFIAKFIHKCLNLDSSEIFHDWFKLNYESHPYSTTSKFTDINNSTKSNNIFIQSARTSFYGLRLIKVEGPKIWNSIPKIICNNNAVKSFVKCLKNYLVNNHI